MTRDTLITRLAAANPYPTITADEVPAPGRDPVEERLFAAIAHEAHPPTGRRQSPAPGAWRRGRPIAVVLAALVVCASAAAAIVSLTGQGSQPLAGKVPGTHTPRSNHVGAESVAGDAYRITVAPDLEAGDAGWCTDILYNRANKQTARGSSTEALPSEGSGGGCETGGGYPTSGRPLFGSFAHWGVPTDAPSGDTVGYVLTGPQVAAIRIGTSTILARSQPGLPTGDRIAVFFLPAKSAPVMVPPAGTPYPYDFRVPSEDPYLVHLSKTGHPLPPGHPPLVRATPILALDAAGHVIRYGDAKPSAQGTVRFWQQHPNRSLRAHGITGTPAHGACEIAQQGRLNLKALFGRTVDRIVPRSGIDGQAFLSCLDTSYESDRALVRAAVLLDARDPGRTLTPIPGAKPVVGHPGIVNVPLGMLPGAITARKERDAWLVIQGGQSESQRLEVLRALRITKIATTG